MSGDIEMQPTLCLSCAWAAKPLNDVDAEHYRICTWRPAAAAVPFWQEQQSICLGGVTIAEWAGRPARECAVFEAKAA